MSVTCAWCHRLMSDEVDGETAHGICRNCAADLQFLPESLDRFLDEFDGAILVVDEEGRVLGANLEAIGLVRLEPGEGRGTWTGEVLSCVYAQQPGGCGHTTHCTGCAIRRALEHTAATGKAVRKTPAFAHRRGPDGPVHVCYLVSTERLGPLVLVQLEQVDPQSAVYAGVPA